MKLLSQHRATYALERVRSSGEDPEYAGFCRDFPTMILQNGLGQSLAFLCSKDAGSATALYADVSRWLIETRGIYAGGDLLEAIMNGDRREYIEAQEETLELAGWLKRFSDALIVRSAP